jgi:pimeloyl-ACP methyl ester carboxylesterase
MRWLLLRGLIREQRHWLDFPKFFQKHVKGPDATSTEIVLVDLPGFGTQNDAVVPATIPGFVDDMRVRFRELVPAGEPCGIVAVSLGGMVALTWLAQHPEDFAAGVIINSSLGDVSPVWHRMRPANWPRILRAPFMDLRARERMLLSMTRHQGDLEADADRYAQIGATTTPKRNNAIGQIRAAIKVKTPAHLEVPTLVLASKGDNLVSYQCSEAIAKKLSLPIRLHEGQGHAAAGHDLPVDAPDWVCMRINEWVQTL